MIDELRAMAIFSEVVKQGSFSKAAESLDLSPSVVSYQIEKLEKKVNRKLLYRSTRTLSLSSDGKEFHRYVIKMLEQAHAGLSYLQGDETELVGTIKVTLPNALIYSDYCTRLANFSRLHPKLNLVLSFTDHREHLIAQGIDLAIRAGEIESSSLVCRRIGEIKRKLVCSPEFLEKHHTPKTISELAELNWIRLASMPAVRTLISSTGERVECHYQSSLSVNHLNAMTQLCIAGAGIATLVEDVAQQEISKGRLVELLPSWQVTSVPLFAVSPHGSGTKNNVEKLLHYLTN